MKYLNSSLSPSLSLSLSPSLSLGVRVAVLLGLQLLLLGAVLLGGADPLEEPHLEEQKKNTFIFNVST